MANIQPQSIVHVFKDVMLDKSYKHAYYLGDDPNATNNFVNTLLNGTHFLKTFSSYTYLRENRYIIRVKCRADDLWEGNYIAYKNPIIGATKADKWFFGFIDETVYVNNETTDIYFTPDIMTTWWHEHHLGKCYVERMHEPNDVFGKNLVAEPVTFGDYKYAMNGENIERLTLVDLNETLTIVPEAKLTQWENVGLGFQYPDIVVERVPQGYRLRAFETSKLMRVGNPQYTRFTQWISNLWNVLSNGSRILGLFLIPTDLVDPSHIVWDDDDLPNLEIPPEGLPPMNKNGYLLEATNTLDGYLPANPKLYTAPFCTCEVITPSGDSINLRHEYMPNLIVNSMYEFYAQTSFRICRKVFPPISILIRPIQGYACGSTYNAGYDANVQLEFDDFPVGSWTWGVFEQWIAKQLVPTVIDAGLIGASLAGGLNIRSATTSSGIVKSASATPEKGITKLTQTETYGTKDTVTNTGVVSGIKQSANFAKEAYNWLQQVPASRGTSRSSSAYTSGESFIEARCLCPNHQDAERIDRFFTAFGYAQDKIMQPYRCVREHWTYLQTNDCKVHGNLPSEVCFELERIYNSGITFWTDIDAIGNYQYERGYNNCLNVPKL